LGFDFKQEGEENLIIGRRVGRAYLVTPIALSKPGKNAGVKGLSIIGEPKLTGFSDFRVFKVGTKSVLTYSNGKDSFFAEGTGKTLLKWNKKGKAKAHPHCLLIPRKSADKKYLAYCGNGELRVGRSKDFNEWIFDDFPAFSPRLGYFDSENVWPVGVSETKEGIFLLYYCSKTRALGAALFNPNSPGEVIWRTADPIWVFQQKVNPLGGRVNNESAVFYYSLDDGNIFKLKFSIGKVFGQREPVPSLLRSEHNPVISPNPDKPWESQYTFNTAILYEKKKFHFIYRAIGDDGQSVFGYASSHDGITLSERSPEPAFVHEIPPLKQNMAIQTSHMSSGAGWGGSEDPRLTKLGHKVFMTYTAIGKENIPQVALTSIRLDDFLNKKWKWSKPIVISPPNETHKNWVLFPKKINGKYAIMHSITPNIMIEYLDDLDFEKRQKIKSKYVPEHRKKHWDTRIRGVGSPPVETDLGWLVFYHAINAKDPGRYKMGAMILDKYNPEKILYRSVGPVLEPDHYYENTGFKPGIVYNCGTVVVDGILYVYYGAADTVVCLATAKLDDFLDCLKASAPARIDSIFSNDLI
jgi:predicted GH43/DUF377 family glycosyl hydrolase